MIIETDQDRNTPLSIRERICLKLILLIFSILHPAKYTHQIEAVVKSIEAELTK